ncbi:hypothetical protein KV100_01955 [Mumia sp. zg.B21]|uniref:hypothetical protein n=1 Tax=unclassified Mumia TaxID=2621872 RepID=UPI001C6E7B7B|nr:MULTISPECIES: hypothetical protein [unclassified Mumia]MBW9208400.1 hypothetical protein [Mumia sp. zg.B21]MDD9348586.1 hypothetical protein [Mumia sp.]
MLIIVAAAVMLGAVLAYPYRGKHVPSSVWGAESIDRLLVAIADRLDIGRHPEAEVAEVAEVADASGQRRPG